ncbi:MAG: DUF1697 domain-containing protein [Blastocatellia bacterium]|nr:DUF1697 domain-containing protein [Blastocatellia bacterium]
MSRYIAFLRAVNVGGRIVKMKAALRSIFEELGYQQVSTFIASGNVIFETRSGSRFDSRAQDREQSCAKRLDLTSRRCFERMPRSPPSPRTNRSRGVTR